MAQQIECPQCEGYCSVMACNGSSSPSNRCVHRVQAVEAALRRGHGIVSSCAAMGPFYALMHDVDNLAEFTNVAIDLQTSLKQLDPQALKVWLYECMDTDNPAFRSYSYPICPHSTCTALKQQTRGRYCSPTPDL